MSPAATSTRTVLAAFLTVTVLACGDDPQPEKVGTTTTEPPEVADTTTTITIPEPVTTVTTTPEEPCDHEELAYINQQRRELAKKLTDHGFTTRILEPDEPCEPIEVETILPGDGPNLEPVDNPAPGPKTGSNQNTDNGDATQPGGDTTAVPDLSEEAYNQIVETWLSGFVFDNIDDVSTHLARQFTECLQPTDTPEEPLNCDFTTLMITELPATEVGVNIFEITDPEILELIENQQP